jgi:hypothetical protein
MRMIDADNGRGRSISSWVKMIGKGDGGGWMGMKEDSIMGVI